MFCKEVFQFVTDFAKRTRPDQTIVATSMIYFHKYCRIRSFTEFNRFLIGVVCVFLACKVKYVPLRLEQAVKVFYELEFKLSNPKVKRVPPITSSKLKEYGEDFKSKELELLEVMGFDFETHLPYPVLSDI